MLLILVAGLLAGTSGEDRIIPPECKPNLLTHYRELGCTPVFGTGPCPIKYDCPPILTRSSDKCYVGGQEYGPDESIGSFFRACSASCLCRASPEGANVVCASVECPELFNRNFIRPGCTAQYSIDDCCSRDQFCPNATKTTTDVTCEYNGSTLIDGQKFYPTEDSCKVCVCQQGFNGTLAEPWCRAITCGTELHYGDDIRKGCIPIYYGGCCPATYRCPEDGDAVVPNSSASSADARTSDEKCTYGTLQMNVGDELSAGTDQCIKCTCKVPPLPVCENTCNN